jgi:hypothetical protein
MYSTLFVLITNLCTHTSSTAHAFYN